jgi:hypothetical protein
MRVLSQAPYLPAAKIRAGLDGADRARCHGGGVKPQTGHRPLCTLELIAQGRAARCHGETCAFWERGCVLDRIEAELAWRPEVAQLLLDLRRALEAGHGVEPPGRASAGSGDGR